MIKIVDLRIILVVIVLILVGFLYTEHQKNAQSELQFKRYEENIAAMRDSIRQGHDRENKLYYEKSILIATNNDLGRFNENLSEEIKKQGGRVEQLTSMIITFVSNHKDPVPGTVVVKGDPCDSIGGDFTTSWSTLEKYDSLNYRKLEATTVISLKNKKVVGSKTNITTDELAFNLITGVEKKNDKYEIFVKSNYPGFKPTKIDGAIIPTADLCPTPKIKHWSIGVGPQIGIGAARGISQPVFYIGLGFGIQYTFLRF